MYNAIKPQTDELPSSSQLIKSTILALVAALIILVTVILPAEYGIDPTRIGRALGLAEMGEIKTQLAEEAESDRRDQELQDRMFKEMDGQSTGGDQSNLFDVLHGVVFSTANAQEAWKDEISFTLSPGEGTEYKLSMTRGAVVEYVWTVDGGVANFDLHGDGSGNSISYEKGRAVPGDEGDLVAAFSGYHGWFWRNRDSDDITITLRVRGEYAELKKM